MLIEKNNEVHHRIKKKSIETTHEDLERFFTAHNQAEFVSMAGHEMKTSIQAILTYSELLQNRHDDNREEYVKAILRNAVRLKMLSNNLADLTKIDANILKIKKERFDICALISSLVEDFRNMNRHHESRINISVQSPEHIFINADVERISQVILNLLDNATKFTKKGRISIKLEERQIKNHILVTVTDTGSGIDNAIKTNLFNKFTTSSGTGLGLYICKNIIESHGGSIWAENNSDKNGATFSFKIPVIQDSEFQVNSIKFLNSRAGS